MHTLPALPYAADALAPHISAETLGLHHGKHHQAYVDNLNRLLAGHELAGLPAADLLRRIGEVDPSIRQKVLDNAGQHLNHSFYWTSLRPASRGRPGGAFLAAIDQSFGSFDALVAEFTRQSLGHFGSGWCWIVRGEAGALEVVTTHDAGTPLTAGQVPLLVCDLWEHAYYVDRRNDRAAYLREFWEVADWAFAERNFHARRDAAKHQ